MNNEYYMDLFLCFGLYNSPVLFTKYTVGLEHVSHVSNVTDLLLCLDDISPLSKLAAPSTSQTLPL